MQIGGIGGLGIGGLGFGGIGFGRASSINVNLSTGGAGGTAPDQAGMSGVSPQMNQLVELMQGMTTAQILMALMIASGGKSDDDDKNNSNAALGFLAGMAMASQMNQLPMSIQFTFDSAGTGLDSAANGMAGVTGMTLNLLV